MDYIKVCIIHLSVRLSVCLYICNVCMFGFCFLTRPPSTWTASD